MFNEPSNELRNIQREIDRIVDQMIALLPPEERATIIRKGAERREKTQIQATILEAKRAALEKELEAIKAEAEHERTRTLQEWQSQMDELQQLLASVPKLICGSDTWSNSCSRVAKKWPQAKNE
jgi:hypothetical protein